MGAPFGSAFPIAQEGELFVLKGHATFNDGLYVYIDSEWHQVGPPVSVSSGGQSIPAYFDTTRNKLLSSEVTPFVFGGASIKNDTWLGTPTAIGENAGFTVPSNGTVVGISARVANCGNCVLRLSVYLNAVENTNTLTLNGVGSVPLSASSNSLNLDFSVGDYIRVRSRRVSGNSMSEVTVVVFVKWRYNQ